MRRHLALPIVLSLVPAAVAVLVRPAIALVGMAAFFLIACATRLSPTLPRIFLSLLGGCLLAYAIFGRGFAYMGVPPLFVGEMVLAGGLLALVFHGRSLLALLSSPVARLLVVFMLLGAAATVPYLGEYSLDALRDAVAWGYGVFALLVAAFLLKTRWLHRVVAAYGRLVPILLGGSIIVMFVRRLVPSFDPILFGSDAPLLGLKPGDMSVHLAGALAFLVLGLHRAGASDRPTFARRHEWIVWSMWLIGAAAAFSNRGGMLSVLLVAMLLLVMRPFGNWSRLLLIGGTAVTLLVAFDVEVQISDRRPISVESVVTSVQSIIGDVGEGDYDNTRGWRLAWWSDIVRYTFFGDYFWEGKGYGINLANADGYQVLADESLRSPHNGHMTILARSGVPGLLVWVALQAAFGVGILYAQSRAAARGHRHVANVHLWILCYWLAFMVNGAFDVFLEGPQGGIWFWSLVGMGIAAMEWQRSMRREEGEARRA